MVFTIDEDGAPVEVVRIDVQGSDPRSLNDLPQSNADDGSGRRTFARMGYSFGLYFMAALYFAAGIVHFVKPQFYLGIMPRWLPSHGALIWVSGLAEVVLGIGLLSEVTRAWAAWGIIAMLAVFLLVHFDMALTPGAGKGLPTWALWGRIFAQFLLIAWAWRYTQT